MIKSVQIETLLRFIYFLPPDV